MLIDLGLKKYIIATTSQDFYYQPESVGSFIAFSQEKILSLKPSHILCQSFQESRIKAIVLQKKTMKAICIRLKGIKSIIQAAKKIKSAFSISKKINYRSRIQSLGPKLHFFRFLAVVDRDPEWKRIFAVGPSSYISELLILLGGQNVIQEQRDYLGISQEFLLKKWKGLIIDLSGQKINDLQLKLVNKKVIVLKNKKLTIPDLRFIEKMKWLYKKLRVYVNQK